VASRVWRYDPDGDCCKGSCIGTLHISAHGAQGSGDFGDLLFGDSQIFTADVISKKRDMLQLPSVQEAIAAKARFEAMIGALRNKLCRNATVVFNVCEFAQSPAALSLVRQRLGAGVSIDAYSGKCGYYFGNPIPLTGKLVTWPN
jgi:hypothetical protein